MQCLLCQRTIKRQTSISQLLILKPISRPVICEHCRETFEKYRPPFCPGCGRHYLEGLCPECQLWQRKYGWLLHNRCLFRYNEALKEYMHRYKFVGDYRLRLAFKSAMQNWIGQQQFDYLIPIPVTQETMATRGFNQAAGLLNHFDNNLLVTKSSQKGVPQSAKSREERLKTPQPFKLQSGIDFCNRRILLVDDIYTTGRTLYHAATLFKEAGVRSVFSLTLSG